MQDWIQGLLNNSQLSLAVLTAAFLMGLLGSVTSCCTPAVVGAIVGYSGSEKSGGRRATLLVGAFFLIGTLVAVAALGAVAGFAGQVTGAALGRYWKAFGGLVTVFFGLAVLNIVPFKLPRFHFAERAARKGVLGAAIFGFAVGGGSAACGASCNPLIAVPLGVAVLQGNILWGAMILAVYAIGYSLPFAAVLVGLRAGIEKVKGTFKHAAAPVRSVAGIVLILAGFYMLATM